MMDSEVMKLAAKWREAASSERDYYADALRACADELEAALAAPSAGAEAVVIETVGFVREDAAGDRFIDWTLEGGISALEIGCELTATDVQVTNDEGYGEVYTAPPTREAVARALSMLKTFQHQCEREHTARTDQSELAEVIAALTGDPR